MPQPAPACSTGQASSLHRSAHFCKGSARESKTPSRSWSARVRNWTPRTSWRAWSMPGTARVPGRGAGELAVRGGIIDVFGSTASLPIRIDLFGDEVERLTAFEVASQRSEVDLEKAELFGCREVVSRRRARPRSEAVPGRPGRPRRISRGSRTGSSSTAWSHGCRGSARRSTSSPTCSTRARGSCSSSRDAYVTERPSSWTRRSRSARAWRRPGGSRRPTSPKGCRGSTSASTGSCSTPPPRSRRCSPSPRARARSRFRLRTGRRYWAIPPGSPVAWVSSPTEATGS